jgi:hypothetical protein
MDLPDDGLAGSGTARVDVEDAGLCAGEDSGEELKMYLLAPTPGCNGDVAKTGAGIPKRGLEMGLAAARTNGRGCIVVAVATSCCCR